MNFSLLKKIFLFGLLLVSFYSPAQTFTLSQKAKVSVITCDTGNESYSLFGHTAIRITDTENNIDYVYNYGAFDFNTPNFVAKFTKGDLQYFAVANRFPDFINQYTYDKRSVFEQELNIPWAYKQKLYENLTQTLSSSDSYYTYKFIDKNCTSMVVDMLNKTLGGKIITKKTDTNITYRSILFPYFDNFFLEQLGTSIIFGSKVDELGTKLFLPLELHQNLAQTQFKNHSLCKESKTLLEFLKEAPAVWWNSIYIYLLFLVIILVLNKKIIDDIYLSFMGILGLFFIFMGFYSLHHELAYNYNTLLFNPSLLLLLYFSIRKNNKIVLYLSAFNILSLVVYLLFIANKAHLWIVMPMVLTNLFILGKIIFKNSKRIPIIV